ncbi:MAG: tRNA(Ile)-lysidine synthase [Patiriisocius sp.]|jgi:tRNA(Ile)-lysidine synthase
MLESVPGRIIVAYSGGCDSHVLLHLLQNQLSHPVEALHVNHGLNSSANDWQAHCESICDQLKIPLMAFRVTVKQLGSLETNARAARYQVFELEVQSDDLLVMGHHQDDQVETILLNMMSGRAPLGIQGMPAERALGLGRLLRPLLHQSRDNLRRYALEQGLQWIEDASNEDTKHDRNYLRRKVIPGLSQRWPEFNDTLVEQWARASGHLNHLEMEAKSDFVAMSSAADCIDFPSFFELPETRQVALLRYWFRTVNRDRVPGGQTLQDAVRILCSQSAESPIFELGHYCWQRFRSRLVLIDKQAIAESDWVATLGEHKPFGAGLIAANVVKGQGVSVPVAQLRFRTRRDGDKLLINGHHRTLKNLFQESGYPPLVRNQIPLVFDGDQMVGICGIGAWGIDMVAGDLAKVSSGAEGTDIHWRPQHHNRKRENRYSD